MSAQIHAALQQLDPQNDNHWTEDGLPRIETVRFLAKDSKLTRDDITKAAPDFSRTVPVIESEGDGNGAAPETGGHGGPHPDAQAEAVQGLEAELAEAQAALDACSARIAEAQKEQATRRAQVDRLLEALHQARPSDSLAQNIQSYLTRQQETLQKRAEAKAKLASVGGLEALKAILPQKAPIDAARARKR